MQHVWLARFEDGDGRQGIVGIYADVDEAKAACNREAIAYRAGLSARVIRQGWSEDIDPTYRWLALPGRDYIVTQYEVR